MATDKKYDNKSVEKLATELGIEYQNIKFFKWYCGVIYEFGIPAILTLRRRVSDAKNPGPTFTSIIKDWRSNKSKSNGHTSE